VGDETVENRLCVFEMGWEVLGGWLSTGVRSEWSACAMYVVYGVVPVDVNCLGVNILSIYALRPCCNHRV
jgi:hypothetical protein